METASWQAKILPCTLFLENQPDTLLCSLLQVFHCPDVIQLHTLNCTSTFR